MTDTASFWDKHAQGYAKRPIKNMSAYEMTLDHVRRYLKPTDTVVELGCGTGTTALLLADNVHRITGTDISGGMIEIANGKLLDNNVSNVEFLQSEASCAELPDNGYDAVLAFSLIHLLPNAVSVSQTARRLLRPGGLFISKTPCLAEGNRLLPALIWVLRKIGYAPYVNFLNVQGLENAMELAGLEILETTFYPAGSSNRFIVARRPETH